MAGPPDAFAYPTVMFCAYKTAFPEFFGYQKHNIWQYFIFFSEQAVLFIWTHLVVKLFHIFKMIVFCYQEVNEMLKMCV